jgi:putative ubiquitin-RnfH superfamily antitoxin RatB of RatAB toxin-antitoxin module
MTDRSAIVEVVYALPDSQTFVEVVYEAGLTAAVAVQRSGLPGLFPEIARCELVLGVWGVAVSSAHVLRPGDRVEISRPLLADPRAMRRDLLLGGRVMGGAEAPTAKLRKKGSA